MLKAKKLYWVNVDATGRRGHKISRVFLVQTTTQKKAVLKINKYFKDNNQCPKNLKVYASRFYESIYELF